MNNTDNIEIEKEKLELEKQKIQFEREKSIKDLEFQRERFYKEQKSEKIKTISTALSIIIPLIVIGLTINSNLDLQARQAEYNFELKAAELVMDAKTPIGTQHKAMALQRLFPRYLSDNFGRNFDPSSYSIDQDAIDRENKNDFLQMLIQNGNLSTKELINWYVLLFPEDKWMNQNGTVANMPREKIQPYGRPYQSQRVGGGYQRRQ
jgi:hypothetical protein